jgi:hypothetical protein
MADPVTRQAARWALLIALPAALVAGFLAYRVLGGLGHPGATASASPAPQATGPVAVPAPPLPVPVATACHAVVSRLPEALRDRRRRPVTAGENQNAAYGDPPITFACGAGTPSVDPEGTVYNLSGVCWYAVTGPDATVWTTVDRAVPVTVTIPARYDAQAQWAIEFSPAVATLPGTTGRIPLGCSR